MKRIFAVAALLGLFALGSEPADAGTLVLNFSGEFGPTTTLGGVALGADTPFSFTASFDSSAGIAIQTGVEIFPTVATFDIAGHGTFMSAAGADLYVGLEDPTAGFHGYGAVLTNEAVTHDFGAAFSTATPPIDADDPATTVFSGLINAGGFLHLSIPLQGGAGDLVVNDLVSTVATASITSAVPEPSAVALFGIALAFQGRSSSIIGDARPDSFHRLKST